MPHIETDDFARKWERATAGFAQEIITAALFDHTAINTTLQALSVTAGTGQADWARWASGISAASKFWSPGMDWESNLLQSEAG